MSRFDEIAADRPRHASAMPDASRPSALWTGTCYLDLLNPHPDDIRLGDIARGLANTNRYNGLSKVPFSVALHSILAADMAREDGVTDKRLLATILMHDATEAYVGDSIRSVKHCVPALCDLEDRVWRVIAEKWGLYVELPPEVKFYDQCALAVEKRLIVGETPDEWPGLPDVRWHDTRDFFPLPCREEAERAFLTLASNALLAITRGDA